MSEFATLKPYVRKYKRLFAWGFLAIIGTTFFQNVTALLIRFTLDSFSKEGGPDHLIRFALLIVSSAAITGTFQYFMRRTIIDASRWVQFDLRNDFFKHLQKLSSRFYQNIRTGDLMSRATQDFEQVRMFVGPGVMYITTTVFSLLFSIILMSFINGKLTILALVPMPFMVLAVLAMGPEMERRFDRVQAFQATLASKVQENLSGVRVVQTYLMEQREIRNFEQLSQEFVGFNLRAAKIYGLIFPLTGMIAAFSVILVLWQGGKLAVEKAITVGDLVMFFYVLSLLTFPIIAIGWVINLYQRGLAGMKRINVILAAQPEITSPQTPLLAPSISGEIILENVTFGYAPNYPILRNINLTIPAGHTLGIVGPVGCGKSTLVNLLPRTFDVTGGRILLDGHDLREYSLETLRDAIAMVPQEVFLFSDTVKENVAFGRKDPTLAELDYAMEVAQLTKDLPQLPKGMDTILGERGINLSGGQKQRTGLARAILRNPKILILDDTLSAVDHDTEMAILQGLKGFMAERTTLLISHRINTVKDADHIVVIKDGEITEQGTHHELVFQGGYYAELNRRQLIEEELEALA